MKNVLTYFWAIVAVVVWGLAFIWSDQLIKNGIPVFYYIPLRLLLAGIMLLIMSLCTHTFQKIERADLPKFLLLALFQPMIYMVAQNFGIQATGSPTISSMVIASSPIFSIAAGILFFREKITGLNVVGVLLAIAGVCLVVFTTGNAGPKYILGICLLVIAVISQVGHGTMVKKLPQKYSSQTITMYQFLIGGIYLLPFFFTNGIRNFDSHYLAFDVWAPIICMAVLCSALAFSLWISTIRKLGVGKSSVIGATIPVASALEAWLLGRELISAHKWLGILLAVLGVILSQYVAKGKNQ